MNAEIRTSLGNAVALSRLRIGARRLRESPEAFLRLVATKKYEEEALSFIQDKSPVSSRSAFLATRNGRILTLGRSLSELGLRASWRTQRTTTGDALGFSVYSMLETRAGRRGYTKLASIEYGNRFMRLTGSTASYTFVGDRAIVRVIKGRLGYQGPPLERPARAGLGLTSKTSEYIRNSILPRLSADIQQLAARRFTP